MNKCVTSRCIVSSLWDFWHHQKMISIKAVPQRTACLELQQKITPRSFHNDHLSSVTAKKHHAVCVRWTLFVKCFTDAPRSQTSVDLQSSHRQWARLWSRALSRQSWPTAETWVMQRGQAIWSSKKKRINHLKEQNKDEVTVPSQKRRDS